MHEECSIPPDIHGANFITMIQEDTEQMPSDAMPNQRSKLLHDLSELIKKYEIQTSDGVDEHHAEDLSPVQDILDDLESIVTRCRPSTVRDVLDEMRRVFNKYNQN